MEAAVVHDFDAALRVEQFPEPALRPGCVICNVEAAFVPSPMLEFTRGRVPFALPPPPYVPGTDAVGTVAAVADDVHGLEVGQPVYCDDYVTLKGRDSVGAYVGLAAMMPGAEAVLAEWPHGCYAEQFMLPAECVTPLGSAASIEPAVLSRLGYLGTSYNAIRRGDFQPGQVAVVNGATGVLGVGTVLLLLALGAARIVALGRKADTLERLRALDPARVAPLAIADAAPEPAAIVDAAGGPAQLFVDAIGFTTSAQTTLAGIGALGLEGHAVLIGGVDAQFPIVYATQMIGLKLTIRGSEWFPRAMTADLLRLVGSGALDLSSVSARSFPLEATEEALAHAAKSPGGFEHVCLLPGG